jgi:MFS family permease
MVAGRIAARLGRRGLVLIIVGIIWIFYGFGVFAQIRERFSRPGPSPLDWMDNPHWGWMWIACGMVGIAIGLGRRAAPDVIGFSAIILPVLPWLTFFGYSFLVNYATGGVFGEPNNFSGFLVWSLVAVFIRVIAGWDDPDEPVKPRESRL